MSKNRLSFNNIDDISLSEIVSDDIKQDISEKFQKALQYPEIKNKRENKLPQLNDKETLTISKSACNYSDIEKFKYVDPTLIRRLQRIYPFKTKKELINMAMTNGDSRQHISQTYQNHRQDDNDRAAKIKQLQCEIDSLWREYNRYPFGARERIPIYKRAERLRYKKQSLESKDAPKYDNSNDTDWGMNVFAIFITLIVLGVVGYYIVWPILQFIGVLLFPYALAGGPDLWPTDASTDLMWTFCAAWGIIVFIIGLVAAFR